MLHKKSTRMTSNLKQIKKNIEHRKTKNYFFERKGRRRRLIQIRIEQNNDHARIIRISWLL